MQDSILNLQAGRKLLKHRFLLHSVSHTIVVVDSAHFGLPTEVYPLEGQQKLLPGYRFQSWRDAAQYLSKLGADTELIGSTEAKLNKTSVAVMTIV